MAQTVMMGLSLSCVSVAVIMSGLKILRDLNRHNSKNKIIKYTFKR